jgi:DNA invertase Pin-like site-specific DNA recombinase
MSTDHQQYSTENQSAVITQYAHNHRMQIVRDYADLGKSGLTLQHRDGLRQLLNDVESGAADFSAVLVYDVSRWGRFQDADESAFYEYRCKRAQIDVHYCAEPFANDGSIPSTLLKAIKRAMAGEYSRELSAKVFAGKSRLIELGFRQGGTAGLGLRRLLLDQHGTPRGLLKPGDRKSLFTDRVILVPGPEEEIRTVCEIYDWFLVGGESLQAIARGLNQRGVSNEFGRPWSRSMVKDILTNPKYTGANVSNRSSCKLGQKEIKNPPEMWVRREGAFSAIVDAETFRQAQEAMVARQRHCTDDELLESLKGLLGRAGELTGNLIDKSEDLHSRAMFTGRFGNLLAAYRRIGYQPADNYEYIEVNKDLALLQAASVAALAADRTSVGATVSRKPHANILTVNEEFTVELVLVRCRHTKHRGERWFFRFAAGKRSDITIAARMAPANKSILDYYIFPQGRGFPPQIDIGAANGIMVDVHRFDNLSFVMNLARRVNVKELHETTAH